MLVACCLLIGFSSGCESSVVFPEPSPQHDPVDPPRDEEAADVGSPDRPVARSGTAERVVDVPNGGGADVSNGGADVPNGGGADVPKPNGGGAGDRCAGPFPGAEPSDGSGYYLKPGLLYPAESSGVYMGQLSLGDIDGDRRFDFVSTDRKALYLQTHPRVRDLNGEVIYTPSTPANAVEDTLLLDADRDGALDVVVAQQEGLAFLRNQGGGAFEPPRMITAPTTFSPNAVDHDGDGVLDIVGLGYHSKILVYRGDGGGGFELAHELPAGVFMSGIVTGDVTGDGHADAVIAMTGVGAGIAVFPHDIESGFDTTGQQVFFETTPPSSGVSFVSVAVGDVNNDGRQDVAAVTHEYSDGPMRVWILLQDGLGHLTAPQPLLTIDDHQYFVSGGLQITDLNLDGRSDLVAVSRNTAEMWSFLQTQEGTFEAEAAPFPGTFENIDGFGVGITDFDCNGCPDVVGVQLDGLVVFRGRGCATAP
ncbi:VCBS repeat-containing protein [Sorangium sp. So ce1504]|uniref:FG-GAP repeat domain-containing protein n=1 Tax=Sorangium sp. So ce1504 TaxID=3133337 RepID=UPI003F5E4A15